MKALRSMVNLTFLGFVLLPTMAFADYYTGSVYLYNYATASDNSSDTLLINQNGSVTFTPLPGRPSIDRVNINSISSGIGYHDYSTITITVEGYTPKSDTNPGSKGDITIPLVLSNPLNSFTCELNLTVRFRPGGEGNIGANFLIPTASLTPSSSCPQQFTTSLESDYKSTWVEFHS